MDKVWIVYGECMKSCTNKNRHRKVWDCPNVYEIYPAIPQIGRLQYFFEIETGDSCAG